jgi:hypothetical protein
MPMTTSVWVGGLSEAATMHAALASMTGRRSAKKASHEAVQGFLCPLMAPLCVKTRRGVRF